MTFIHAIILGLIEGITEFLPISSTGHLILASDLLKIPDSDFLTTFEIAIQLGAILSIVFLYWRRVMNNTALVGKVLAAFIPTAVIGLVAYPFVKGTLLGNEQVVIWALLVGGALLYYFEKYYKRPVQGTALDAMTYKQAVLVGLAQGVAVIPGVSRAAATILGGLGLGIDRKAIVEFSFLLAIPTMAAATVLDVAQTGGSFTNQEWGVLAVGFVTSFIVALAAVRWLLKYVQSHDFTAFGLYRIVLAVLFWLWLM